MRLLRTVAELRAWREERVRPRSDPSSLGLVATMGSLHDGHVSLVRRSVRENDLTLATVFVNPSQFNDSADLESYPRDLEADALLLEKASCDALFAPGRAEIYPSGYQTWVDVGPLADRLEGAGRPGHFRGVATVVTKLLHLAQPDRAYFGRKDAQQLKVVERLVRDLDMGVGVVGCETVREPDGLAMSSRNLRLSVAEREIAPLIFRSLMAGLGAWSSGVTSAVGVIDRVRQVLATDSRLVPEYVSVSEPDSLEELDVVQPQRGAVLSLAVRLGEVRLIDNLLLPPMEEERTEGLQR